MAAFGLKIKMAALFRKQNAGIAKKKKWQH